MSDPYRPIAEYALIGDCHTAALVSGDGSVDWLCAPDFDGPSVLAALLDAERGGRFAVRPAEPFASENEYVGHSGVLRTTFRTDGGVATLTDFMPIHKGSGPRPFADAQAPRRLVRLVEGIEGEVSIGIDFRPRPDYGAEDPEVNLGRGGVVVDASGGYRLYLRSSVPLGIEDRAASGSAVVAAGERVALVLDLAGGDGTGGADPAATARELEETLAFWRGWAAGCYYRGPYEEAVLRSAVTLKLLTHAPTGAMVAAPTTSLPEEIGGERNWDYRYTWIRDAAFAVYALFLAGHVEDGVRFVEWVCDIALRCEPGDLRIMYGLAGEHDLPERTLDHLEGYRGSRPVRVGNAASEQFQLDVYGELLDCFHTCRRFGGMTPEAVRALWPAFARQVEVVAERWREPDSGIWEVRSEPRHFVYSKVMAWVALDRGVKAAEELGLPADLPRWRAERDAARAEVLERGYDPKMGAFARSYGEPALDASNLLLPLVGFLGAHDPRVRATVEATERGLVADGLVYRYVGAEDGLPGGEATFGVSTFWLVDNLAALGRVEEARELFERTLARASPLGLYAEELDPTTGAHLGNFPQALTHIGLINSAINLARAGAGGAVRDVHDGRGRDVAGATER
ncbi:MAG: glycoside hydrolase family 15 protein [Actinomycetota bacterium]|nr:glycoside hydrolase family 15 protein [Actinomycetota bacterium]